MKKIILLSLLSALMWSCASHTVTPEGITVISAGEYERIVEKNTQNTEKYQGLYNTLNVTGTFLTTKMAQAQLEQSARLYLWNKEKFEKESRERMGTLEKKTQFFVSFFTPERKNDNLSKSKSIWKVFLDVGGKRYEGKVEKIKQLTAEIQSHYPYHTRWNTPYVITFDVPVRTVESLPADLTLTGSVDQAVLKFNRD